MNLASIVKELVDGGRAENRETSDGRKYTRLHPEEPEQLMHLSGREVDLGDGNLCRFFCRYNHDGVPSITLWANRSQRVDDISEVRQHLFSH